MKLKSFFNDFLNLFYPNLCEVCGNGLLYSEKVICTKCMYNLPRIRFHSFSENKTTELFGGRIPFVNASSYYYYQKGSDFAELLHKLKYNKNRAIGHFLGEAFAEELKNQDFFQDIDLLMPIPLHKRRQRERGYNQSEIIAEGMQRIVPISIDTVSVQRSVYTKTQTARSKNERFENIENAFTLVNQDNISGKHILLIDDVITTGATIEALFKILQAVPNLKISIASLAIAE